MGEDVKRLTGEKCKSETVKEWKMHDTRISCPYESSRRGVIEKASWRKQDSRGSWKEHLDGTTGGGIL